MPMCYTVRMKKWLILLIVLILAAMPAAWFFPALQSYAVMGVYSAVQAGESVMQKNGFSIKMDPAQGWYPFVLTYNADGFSSWSGIEADMSILYGFGAFDAAARTSSLYDENSPFYSAFFGAYAVQKDSGPFGFYGDGSLNMDEVTAAVDYDYTQLVMRNFGCENPVFSLDEYTVRQGISYAGSDGWTRIDALMRLNGVAHNFYEHRTAYLQYGRPTRPLQEDFAVIDMAGRVYAKYFEAFDCTVMLYVMAPDTQMVDMCDRDILSNAVIAGF